MDEQPATHALHIKCLRCHKLEWVLLDEASQWKCHCDAKLPSSDKHVCKDLGQNRYPFQVDEKDGTLFLSTMTKTGIIQHHAIIYCPFCGFTLKK